MIAETQPKRRAPGEATPKQRRYVRRLLGGYVRGIGWQHGDPVFARPEDAVCYALARTALASGAGMPTMAREAHEMIEALIPAAACNYARTEEGLAVRELTRRSEHRDWRRRALSPLAARFGYPSTGWLDRLNAEIAAVFEKGSDIFRERHAVDDALFRTRVVDPLFRMPSEGSADGNPGSDGRAV